MVHLVWSPNGLLAGLGTLDFAGGTVVHINAGVTAFVLSAFLGKRVKFGDIPHTHYNLPWVLLGATILWIGWYGFNAGSAMGVDNIAAQATITTTMSTGTAMVTWMILTMYITVSNLRWCLYRYPFRWISWCHPSPVGLVHYRRSHFGMVMFSTFVQLLLCNYLNDRIGVDDALVCIWYAMVSVELWVQLQRTIATNQSPNR